MIKCVRGLGLKAGQTMFGKADPYAKITIGSTVFETPPHAGGGKDPEWNAEHTFEISTEKEALIEIYDKGQDFPPTFPGPAGSFGMSTALSAPAARNNAWSRRSSRAR